MRIAVVPSHSNAEMTADSARSLSGNNNITIQTTPASVRVSPEPSNKHRLSSKAGNVTCLICQLKIYELH